MWVTFNWRIPARTWVCCRFAVGRTPPCPASRFLSRLFENAQFRTGLVFCFKSPEAAWEILGTTTRKIPHWTGTPSSHGVSFAQAEPHGNFRDRSLDHNYRTTPLYPFNHSLGSWHLRMSVGMKLQGNSRTGRQQYASPSCAVRDMCRTFCNLPPQDGGCLEVTLAGPSNSRKRFAPG